MTAAEREQGILQNLGLVRSCAARLTGRGIEYDDLYQAGCMGLIKALDGFDPSLGNRFSSYAVPLILGEMRQLFREGTAVRVSRGLRSLAVRAKQAREQLLQQTGQEPHISAIAEHCGCSVYQLLQALEAAQQPISVEQHTQHGEQLFAAAEPQEIMLSKIDLKNSVLGLAKQDRLLLYYRYLTERTQCETAALMGVSQSYISRSERRLLARLKGELQAL
ncbi:MAG: sigma-70 family RNA polymerase sigma factor [Oscillospiraceae bacterium]|nr:sigma-70 family RNA polymerase sigma factor [Oscillospiraceae bacterium]